MKFSWTNCKKCILGVKFWDMGTLAFLLHGFFYPCNKNWHHQFTTKSERVFAIILVPRCFLFSPWSVLITQAQFLRRSKAQICTPQSAQKSNSCDNYKSGWWPENADKILRIKKTWNSCEVSRICIFITWIIFIHVIKMQG